MPKKKKVNAKYSLIDYAVMASTIYGIGAAVGVTSAAGIKALPVRTTHTGFYWVALGLGIIGAAKGFKAMHSAGGLRESLMERSPLEKYTESLIGKEDFYV
tara:strand:+ start:214 stop:516 length:303 start_codon:yes stop_codon:yes gene_type:complete